MLKSEFINLENFTNFLSNNNKKMLNRANPKDVTGLHSIYKNISNELQKNYYFQFIPKDNNTTIFKGKLNLAIEMNSLFKYYQLQSYIIGMNCLYLSLIFIKSRNVIGFSSITSIIFATGLTFYIFRYNYTKFFKVMDHFFKDDVNSLYENIKRADTGFTPQVIYSSYKNRCKMSLLKLIKQLKR